VAKRAALVGQLEEELTIGRLKRHDDSGQTLLQFDIGSVVMVLRRTTGRTVGAANKIDSLHSGGNVPNCDPKLHKIVNVFSIKFPNYFLFVRDEPDPFINVLQEQNDLTHACLAKEARFQLPR
jgi:hypothetical protein